MNKDVYDEPAQYVGVLDNEKWGTIYAIKRLGASNAYRVRWQIKLVGNTVCDQGNNDPSNDARGFVQCLLFHAILQRK